MAYAKTDEFVQICIENDYNIKAICNELRKLYPAQDVRPYKVEQRIANCKRRGLLPLASGNSVDRGQVLRATSTLYDSSGNIKQQWIKSDVQQEAILAAFEHAVETTCSSITPIAPIPLRTLVSDSDLLVKIPIADAHMGLLTWHKEVGVDFDLAIAKDLYTKAITQLVDSSPPAETCLLLDLGDTIHTDDQSNQTKAHRHQLDVDGRFDKLFDMTLHMLCTMIDVALTKYPTVIFRKTRGNHDPDSSVAISAALQMRYLNEPRVTIERSPSLFWYYQFGQTLHFSTHGHTVKQAALPEIAAHDCRDIWSSCKFVYIDTGRLAA